MVINGRLARFELARCEFRDSLTFFLIRAWQISESKNEINYELMEPSLRLDANNKALISSYLRQDCVAMEMWGPYRSKYGKSLPSYGPSMSTGRKIRI